MNKQWDMLEILTTSIRFQDKKQRMRPISRLETPISDLLLRKRERLDSEDFKEHLKINQRTFSDILVKDSVSEFENRDDEFKIWNNSLLCVREDSHQIIDAIDMGLKNDDQEGRDEFKNEKIEETTQMDYNGFDFNTVRIKKIKTSKFVIKIDKNIDQVSLNKVKTINRRNDGYSHDIWQPNLEINMINSGSIPQDKQLDVIDEKQKIKTKIGKVNQYWKKESIMIPNVFRLIQNIDDDAKYIIEFHDYSKKSVLATVYSQINKVEQDKVSLHEEEESIYFNEAVSFTHKRSFCQILGSSDDTLYF